MNKAEILEELKISLQEENWDRIVELIQSLEMASDEFGNFYDDPDDEIDF